MGFSQRLMVLLSNTVQFTTRATIPTETCSTKKRQIPTSTSSPPSTPNSSLYLDTGNDHGDQEFHPLSTTTISPQKTIVIAVIGHSHIDKSSLIHCGFSSTMAEQDMKNTPGINTNIRQHSVMLNLNKTSLRHIMFLELDHDLENHDLTTTSIHAALICFDVTQKQSMNGIPDLLNYFCPRQIPVSLLGINSDLAASRQLDFILMEQLALQHSVPFYEMLMNSTFDIQHVFMKLIYQCAKLPHDPTTMTINTDDNGNGNINNNDNTHTYAISPPESFSSCSSSWSTMAAAKTDENNNNTQTISGTTIEAVETNNHHHQETMTTATIPSPSRPPINPIPVFTSVLSTLSNEYRPSMGFAYAPTPAIHHYHQVHHENSPSESLSSSKEISTDNFTSHRRGSKDSCESFGHGLTVDDIIDRLVSPEIGHGDEQMIPIFIIFFRKFMTPFELIQALIKRFEDHMYMPVLPTPQQQRITSVLVSWMADYWGDFHHQQTRHQLNLFFGRLSATTNLSVKTSKSTASSSMLSLQHILDALYNLSIQSVPDCDPDNFWAKKLDDDPVTKINHDKKKETRSIYLHSSGTNQPSPTIKSSKDRQLDYYSWTKLLNTKRSGLPPLNYAQYAASSPPSTQSRPLSPTPRSTLSCTSTSLQNLPMSPESHSRSSTTTYLQSLACRNQSTNINTWRRKATTKPVAVLPSHTSMSRPEIPYLTQKSSTPLPSTSNKNLNKARQYIHQRHEQEMQSSSTTTSSSSSSSSSSSTTTSSLPSSRSLTPNTFRRSISPPPLPSSSSPLSFRSLQPTSMSTPTAAILLNRNHRNNNNDKSSFLHKLLLSTSRSLPPNVSFSSSTCTDISASSSVNSNPSSFKSNTKFILSLSEHDMADQLTWIEAELFGKIKSREFVRMIWTNHDIKPVQQKQHQTQTSFMTSLSSQEVMDRQPDKNDAMVAKSGLLASISHFNFISAWVISMVVTQPKLAKRVALLEKFMVIAVALRDLNNYNSLMAILAGINNAAILRLRQTQEGIKKKKIYKRFQSLERLMGSDRSYCSYRLALKASIKYPSIPYLGIHSQDLIALAEVNKDIKTDGTIHWEKFRLMGDCIMMIMKLQQPKHNVVPDQMILTWLTDFSILTEAEQYQRSMRIEPRLRTTSMNYLRKLW